MDNWINGKTDPAPIFPVNMVTEGTAKKAANWKQVTGKLLAPALTLASQPVKRSTKVVVVLHKIPYTVCTMHEEATVT